jgi:hypothetical protein
VGVLDASTSPPKERYAVSNDNVTKLIQPGFFDDRRPAARTHDNAPWLMLGSGSRPKWSFMKAPSRWSGSTTGLWSDVLVEARPLRRFFCIASGRYLARSAALPSLMR